MFRVLFFLLLANTLFAQRTPTTVTKKFLALGDSYTIGESVPEKERWPVQLAEALRAKGWTIENPKIIATTGWRTDQLKQAIQDADLKNEYGLVSLLIGVNNQYQKKTAESYAAEFEDLMETAISLASGKKQNVFVVSIPDYGYTPFGQPHQSVISKEIDEFNLINKSIAERLGIKYINITDLTREGLSTPSYVAPDGLHPSGEMYSRWVERMLPALIR